MHLPYNFGLNINIFKTFVNVKPPFRGTFITFLMVQHKKGVNKIF